MGLEREKVLGTFVPFPDSNRHFMPTRFRRIRNLPTIAQQMDAQTGPKLPRCD